MGSGRNGRRGVRRGKRAGDVVISKDTADSWEDEASDEEKGQAEDN